MAHIVSDSRPGGMQPGAILDEDGLKAIWQNAGPSLCLSSFVTEHR
jgi:hypothetical protein